MVKIMPIVKPDAVNVSHNERRNVYNNAKQVNPNTHVMERTA
jgi:hypothetical protein